MYNMQNNNSPLGGSVEILFECPFAITCWSCNQVFCLKNNGCANH
uniref:Uncharacterized protein n=1 Tax=Anguilla anguilla TaxID=7936 RepID=A0A0E9S3K3_ANGAN